MKVLRNVSLESFSTGDKVHLKATEEKLILSFITQFHPALPNLKNIQMGESHLKTNPYYHLAKENHQKISSSYCSYFSDSIVLYWLIKIVYLLYNTRNQLLYFF